MAPPPPPPPPPPPFCLPTWGSSKPRRRLSYTDSDYSRSASSYDSQYSRERYSVDGGRPPPPPDKAPGPGEKMVRYASRSSGASSRSGSTLNSAADSLAFKSEADVEDWESARQRTDMPEWEMGKKGPRMVKGKRNAMTGTKAKQPPPVVDKGLPKDKPKGSWGYGWGMGKKKELGDLARGFDDKAPEMVQQRQGFPLYDPPVPPVRTNTQSSGGSRETRESLGTRPTRNSYDSKGTGLSYKPRDDDSKTPSPRSTQRSTGGRGSTGSGSRRTQTPQTNLQRNDSNSTLVGSDTRSAYDRKINDVDVPLKQVETSSRLETLRELMAKDNLDFYIVPSEDAHQSEYVSASDRRREYISGFNGSAGQAIIAVTAAYLITDSRYWLHAQKQIDSNWTLVRAGDRHEAKDWIEWIVAHARNARIGVDARMISHEKATILNSKLSSLDAKLVYPPQNLVDLAWKDKAPKSREPLFRQPTAFAGEEASSKLERLREWIRAQPPAVPAYSKSAPTESQMHVATLVTALPAVAYLLNLRGSDVPFNPLFQGYLWVSLDNAILFVDAVKVNDEIGAYLASLGVERREYVDLWQFLRKREWGLGKILITPQTSFAISLMLTHFRYTVAPSFVEEMMSLKNETEIRGLKEAYLRDGASYVRFLAWLEAKLKEGYEITEYEAAQRLTEFRRKTRNFMGLAYENISASGANAALPHYSPRRGTAAMIDREMPYLNDSGGQYRDGTCDTTRTVHFGHPTPEMCDAYTRVLQGHIAIDSAVFPEGTSGRQLDVLARKALWREGYNYGHGTGHGFGSFLTVHEGHHGFSSDTPLEPGMVTTNEPGFYLEGRWGMRIESALVVRRIRTRGAETNGSIWYGFDRLTVVPIQTKMVNESMLSKEEKAWLKDHNQRCYQMLSPYLKEDKRAFKYLTREVNRGIGVVTGPGGMSIEWD
ncbi:Creatinase aminopeptidase [Mycena kentingensis (nom. inval.)]|nr:Creatinase aminopeptidase [Mycena kentingensis (nom. inval.)]